VKRQFGHRKIEFEHHAEGIATNHVTVGGEAASPMPPGLGIMQRGTSRVAAR
jgi:hypothetical protein